MVDMIDVVLAGYLSFLNFISAILMLHIMVIVRELAIVCSMKYYPLIFCAFIKHQF